MVSQPESGRQPVRTRRSRGARAADELHTSESAAESGALRRPGRPIPRQRPMSALAWPTTALVRSPELEGTSVDFIEIDALRLRCIIGVSDDERRDKQDVVIDLRIEIDARPAAASDDIADGWNYRTATKAVIALVEPSICRTVEALAEQIARLLVLDHAARSVRVRVSKPGALRFSDNVAVVIERCRHDLAGERADLTAGTDTAEARRAS
jgi:FolB domain-containing protein